MKFGDLFKIIKCHTRYTNDRRSFFLNRKCDNQRLTFSVPIFLHSITFYNKDSFHNDATIKVMTRGIASGTEIKIKGYINNFKLGCVDIHFLCIYNTGFNVIRLTNLNNNIRTPFDVDVILAYK